MKTEIEKAAEVIKNGGVILYPTDTIWGLGCDPKNESAIEKLNRLKKRAEAKNYIILVNSEALLSRYVKDIPEVCYDLIDYADKPLTIIYPKGQHVAPSILPDDGSIAIRITKDEFCNELMKKTKSGIISTSANLSGEKFPESFNSISEEIKNNVDYIVNLPTNNTKIQPSQIIKIGPNGEVSIIRK